jgi:purine-nucleoside phosphorylase
VPKHLRPTAPIAADAVLVGDPGRALLLAQELLVEPKMSNHARGLWGYSGKTPAGDSLTIQATGIGGPSAALVLADLAELGVRRAVRVGTGVAVEPSMELGELMVVEKAIAAGGSATALGAEQGDLIKPNPRLTTALARELGNGARTGCAVSFDADPGEQPPPAGVLIADMQTAPLLASAARLDVEAAAMLIVIERTGREGRLEQTELERGEKRAGRCARAVL